MHGREFYPAHVLYLLSKPVFGGIQKGVMGKLRFGDLKRVLPGGKEKSILLPRRRGSCAQRQRTAAVMVDRYK